MTTEIHVVTIAEQGPPGPPGEEGEAGEVTRTELRDHAEVPARIGELVSGLVISSEDDALEPIFDRDEIPPDPITGSAPINFREVDNIVWDPEDPDPNKRYKLYVTLAYVNTQSRIFCKFSPTGEPGSWSEAQRCYLLNVAVDEQAQDPSITCRLSTTGRVYRDGSGRMIMFAELKQTAPAPIVSYYSTDGINWTRTHSGDAITWGSTNTSPGATTNAAGYAIGATVITLASAGTGAIAAGNMVKFAGDTNWYFVATGDTDVSNGGSITLAAPGLLQAIPAAATAITTAVWDANLAGSPCAKWDDVFHAGRFVVGYEGRVAQDVNDAFGLASGATPDALTKYANNPVWHPARDPFANASVLPYKRSIVVDTMFFVSGGWPGTTLWGDRIMFTVHSGNEDGKSWRAYTKKLNPLTWAKDDPITGGGDIRSIPGSTGMDPELVRGEFLLDATSPYRVVAPGEGLRTVRQFLLIKRSQEIVKNVSRVVEKIRRLAPHSNTVASTTLWQLAPPAGYIREGTTLDFRLFGTLLQNTGADRTLRMQFRGGGAVLDSGGGVDLRNIPASADRRRWHMFMSIFFSSLTLWEFTGRIVMSEPEDVATRAANDYAPFCMTNSGEATHSFAINNAFEFQVALGLASTSYELLVLGGDVIQRGNSDL